MAEASVLSKVEDIIQCAMCRDILVDPKTFNCLHSYCAKCVKRLKPTKEGAINGYKCPQCRRFTPQDGVRKVHLVVQLLDAYHAAKGSSDQTKCQRCGKRDASWYCMDCEGGKSAFFDECRKVHDEFIKDHHIVSFEDLKDNHHVLEQPVFCSEHPKYEIEVFCQQCEKTMCVMCKILKHDGHKAEQIPEAVQRLLPQMIEDKRHIEQNIKANKSTIAKLTGEKKEAMDKCDKIQIELNRKLDEDLHKLKEQHKKDSAELETEKTATAKDFDNKIQDVNDKVNEQMQVVAWVNTTATRTKGTTLLRQLQDGLLKKVKEMALGCVISKDIGFHSSRSWPWVARAEITLNHQQTIQLKGNKDYTRISVIWDHLWLINHYTNQVYKYNFDGTQTEVLHIDKGVTTPRTALDIGNEEALLVAKSGLFIINQQAQITSTLLQGNFCDACLASDGILYALEFDQGKIVRLKNSGNDWRKHDKIILENYQQENKDNIYSNKNTMVAKEKHIYVSMNCAHRIIIYDIAGHKVKDIGSSQTGFRYPNICGVDQNNVLLIANCDYRRLDWLESNGARTQQSGFRSVYPWYAVYQNEATLWVLDSESRLHKYSFE